VTNPNCSAIGLVLALKPLAERFGLESVFVSTMQAVSGAGYPASPRSTSSAMWFLTSRAKKRS
jgi:aspartate-semialdehyde dehydrogenase